MVRLIDKVVACLLLWLMLMTSLHYVSAFEAKSTKTSFHQSAFLENQGHSKSSFAENPTFAGGAGSRSQSLGKDGDGEIANAVARATPVLDASAGSSEDASNTFWFSMVTYVCIINAIINLFRPDRDISIQARLPRCMWEAYIALCANFAAANWRQNQTVLVLLSIMTGTTALIDIFIWAPLFAAFASFETCEGGWFTGVRRVCYSDYTKGFGRLFVSAHSLFTGIFFLITSVRAFGAFTAARDERVANRNAEAMSRFFIPRANDQLHIAQ
mmetsp:Transcript_26467/g.41025  ORF Transcript_26467/g.41025 Transcript_26467/m.41025 type:complete len:271 (+) Transcript_26467:120-932(+)